MLPYAKVNDTGARGHRMYMYTVPWMTDSKHTHNRRPKEA